MTQRILINGWFFDLRGSGSDQYLRHLLKQFAQVASTHLPEDTGYNDAEFIVVVPRSQQATSPPSGNIWDLSPLFRYEYIPFAKRIQLLLHTLPPLPENLAKLWWEQFTIPYLAWRLGCTAIWVPYWAAPYWQPRPTVVTVHDMIPALLPAYRGGLLQQIYTRLVTLTARRAAAILTVSEASKRDIVAHLGAPAERVHVVYHGVNVEDSTAGRADLVHEKYGLPARYFLYLGGFDVRKNVGGILLAYQRYLALGGDRAVKLVIAGRLPGQDSAFAPDPRKLAAELALGEQVLFCGWVAEEDKAAIYAGSVGYLFPSLYEGFGMMVLEAMGAGVPVVTSAR